jgi:hypothetical protein
MFSVGSMQSLYQQSMQAVPANQSEIAASKGVNLEAEESGIGNFYHVTSSEDTGDWEDLVCAVVNSQVCELVVAL